jgi:peptidoglycan L-alanyl-D-glutamate endopeptidase CwlK
MINSRKVEDLHPRVQDLCKQFIAACAAQGIRVLIISTYRDADYQNMLYAVGRTKPGKIVTNAKGGESFHQYRCAFDFVPVNTQGGAVWSDLGLFNQCGQIGESVGLQWAGRWTGALRETGHLQFTGGLTLKELQSGVMLPEQAL